MLFKSYFSIVIALLLYSIVNSQSTSQCGKTQGCYLHPPDCKDTDCSFIYKWADDNDKTKFEIDAKIIDSSGKSPSIDAVWLAIGFSKDNRMGDDCVVMCMHNVNDKINKVEHYYNRGKSPEVLDPDNPTVGLSETNIQTKDNFLICKFTRIKQNKSVENYFDLNKRFFILGAFGKYEDDEISFHHHDKSASHSSADFESYNIYSSAEIPQIKPKIHGCVMIFAWILLASCGIFVARYYKHLSPDKKPFGLQIWFFIHRPVMIIACLLTISSFLLILWNNDWTWIYSGNRISFIHSIFGIITVSLVVLQPIIAMLRCDKEHPNRFIFNYVHSSLGILALICSIISMFFAMFLEQMNLNKIPLLLLICWATWILLFTSLIEILKYLQSSNSLSINSDTTPLISKNPPIDQYAKMKSFLLSAHIFVAIGISTSLVVLILTAKSDTSYV